MFDVGDKVIVTEGVLDCEEGCSDAMEYMIGRVLTISEVQEDRYPIVYKTVEDNGRWDWTDRCFVLECPDETPVSDDEFDGIMSFLCQDSTPPATTPPYDSQQE